MVIIGAVPTVTVGASTSRCTLIDRLFQLICADASRGASASTSHTVKTNAPATISELYDVQALYGSYRRDTAVASLINCIADHKQKRARGLMAIIFDCIIASSDARIVLPAILHPLCAVMFRLSGTVLLLIREANETVSESI
ncbi:hypothetical protein EVAR_75845_1 [Eumeta japonica]|uniref:Uncharacterized protein n=1 Tax=Eumeta variegata TaxID=151549 RepID=A0A4C1TE66_EUMVA|nr:hypothetical protein EVAR_75845_1 [Eumeta japonica]